MVNLRLATKEDVKALYPEGIRKSFYGIAAEGETGALGVAGLYFERTWVLFARITPELRKSKKTIWKAAKELMKAIKHLNQPVYAIADPSIPGSDKLLLRMGFKQVSKDWYVWQ